MIKKCRACEKKDLAPVWQLANSPYGGLFQSSLLMAKSVKIDSLTLGFCEGCCLLQLLEETDIEATYLDYIYHSSTTYGLVSYYKQVAKRLTFEYSLSPDDTILDIGSNDGSFLKSFEALAPIVLGVEPTLANAKIARSRGIPTINRYLDEESLIEIKSSVGRISLININYTLANIPNLIDFMNLVVALMDSRTILSVITGYHPDQYLVNMFEYINHDHLSYFTIESMSSLCRQLGLKIIDILKAEHKGGSIQFIITRDEADWPTNSSVRQLVQREKWLSCNTVDFTHSFKNRILEISNDLKTLLDNETHLQICGIGASISTTYLCNQFGLVDNISGLYDDDSNKIGKFAPASGLPVYPLTTLPSGNNVLCILLAWQHTYRFIERLKEIGFSGKVLIPLPKPLLLQL